tara:strand:- start:144 stop:491 length:348 start_codon:yes stop_codon:yes gene_type:complete
MSTTIDEFSEAPEPGLNVYWIYPPFGAHRAVLLDDGRAFYFTTKPAGGRGFEDCVPVYEHESGFSRDSHLNLFEPLSDSQFQICENQQVHSVLSESASLHIIADITKYYGNVSFL